MGKTWRADHKNNLKPIYILSDSSVYSCEFSNFIFHFAQKPQNNKRAHLPPSGVGTRRQTKHHPAWLPQSNCQGGLILPHGAATFTLLLRPRGASSRHFLSRADVFVCSPPKALTRHRGKSHQQTARSHDRSPRAPRRWRGSLRMWMFYCVFLRIITPSQRAPRDFFLNMISSWSDWTGWRQKTQQWLSCS